MPHPAPHPPADSSREERVRATGVPVWTAGRAREAVSRALAGTAGAMTDREADARLVVTELVTNAICHAGGVTGFEVRVEDGGSRLRISVEDADGRHPHGDFAALRDPSRPGGRGWPIVQLLTDVCEVRPLPGGGKRVSATLAL
ncbi:ATP-binding protein [Kitasatospora fiedleri]|uniref:ATP-binding protein n=1 Tax=Kitasatospora fiedleri TaxID=2991545 RepID=UPI00249CABD5|nr:ATP-binding protein [Kitasatospora fiedleri]